MKVRCTPFPHAKHKAKIGRTIWEGEREEKKQKGHSRTQNQDEHLHEWTQGGEQNGRPEMAGFHLRAGGSGAGFLLQEIGTQGAPLRERPEPIHCLKPGAGVELLGGRKETETH